MCAKVAQIRADDLQIIAPCGLNCSLCRAYVRELNPCPGCRGGEDHKASACLACAIKNCKELAAGGHQFCSTCDRYPCADLLHLDARYRTRYGVSAIGNLEHIKAIGVERFLAEEAAKWSCAKCGYLLCMHEPQCLNCGHAWQRRLEPCSEGSNMTPGH